MDQLKYIGDKIYGMRRRLATWGLFLLGAYVAVHVVFGANGWMVYEKKKAEYRQVTAEVEKIKQDNQQVSNDIQALMNDKKAIEKYAREQLGYTRAGEVVYVMPKPQNQSTITATAQSKVPQK